MFFNIALCSSLFRNELRTHSYGLWSYYWITILVTRSLVFASRVLVSISHETGKSWLVSTKMIIPFSLPARVVIEPNYKHIREASDSLFLEKFSSTFKESCRVKWNLVLNVSSVCDACLSLSTTKENLRLAEQEDWKSFWTTSRGATPPLDCFLWERLHLFLSLLT